MDIAKDTNVLSSEDVEVEESIAKKTLPSISKVLKRKKDGGNCKR